MYVTQTNACTVPNSETPMTAARISKQDNRVARTGSRFDRGNAAMALLVDSLSPPVATGTCDDLTSSRVFLPVWPMAWPAPSGMVGGAAGNYPGPAVADPGAVGADMVVIPVTASSTLPGAASAPAVSPGAGARFIPVPGWGHGRYRNVRSGAAALAGSGGTRATPGAAGWRSRSGENGGIAGGAARTGGGAYGRGVAPGSRYPNGPLQDSLSQFLGTACASGSPSSASPGAGVLAGAAGGAGDGAGSSSFLWGLVILAALGFAFLGGNGTKAA